MNENINDGTAADFNARRSGDLTSRNPSRRRLLFLSHATPEDNDFAKWLATRLAVAGYEVWCDITQLLGGERFWADIADAIDDYTFRFLFMSTVESNRKLGTLRELALAFEAQKKHGINDFVVPLKLDQLPFADAHESIQDLNFVPSTRTGPRASRNSWRFWMAKTRRSLRPPAPPASRTGTTAPSTTGGRLSSRTTGAFRTGSGSACPGISRVHRFNGPSDALPAAAAGLSRPCHVHGSYLLTFADGAEIEERLGPGACFGEIIEREIPGFIRDGDEDLAISASEAGNIAAIFCGRLGCRHDRARASLSPSGRRFYSVVFQRRVLAEKQSLLPIRRQSPDISPARWPQEQKNGERHRIRDGFWHYAVSASVQLLPFPRMLLRHHVIFTDDGHTPWANTVAHAQGPAKGLQAMVE